MAEEWEEITSLDGRHELHLTGNEVSIRLDALDGELPAILFEQTPLNYLEVTETTLKRIPASIGKLNNLINLALHRNDIETVAEEVGTLEKLKFADFSFNKLKSVPCSLCKLPILHTLNLGNNKLTEMPDVSKLKQLGKLFLDHNELASLPDGIGALSNLSELYAQGNEITDISPDIQNLAATLRVLNLSENRLKQLPSELSACGKLKELNMKENPFKDNRLKKLVNQCAPKSILDYIGQNSGGGGKKGGGKGKKKGSQNNAESEEAAPVVIADQRMLHVIQHNDDRHVVVKPSATSIRPYIVCTIVRNLDLSEPAMFKKFLSIQTKLHENECEMRLNATIATHRLKAFSFPLQYEALPPEDINIVGLGRGESMTALQLISLLKDEREAAKLKKKRNPKTGLFKFIDLVDNKTELCCLRDASMEVISFPPITNSEKTKMSSSIDDIMIEVTSPVSLTVCKSVMESLISQMFQNGFKSHCEATDSTTIPEGDNAPPARKLHGLVLEQLRIVDHEFNMKVVYPSKTDLVDADAGYQVDRLKDLVIS